MKKYFIILSLFFFVASQAQIPALEDQTKTFKTIADMKLRIGKAGALYNVKGYYEPNDGGGGYFFWDDTATAATDYGTVFSVSGVSTGRWKRNVSTRVSISMFGAVGKGVSEYKKDSTAMENAVEFVRKKGKGSIYFPATDSFYAYTGYGILLPDNIEIYGDGTASNIRYINPGTLTTGYKGVLFFPSTYGPTNTLSVFKAPAYNIYPARKGDSVLKVVTLGHAANLSPGKVIFIGGNKFNKDGEADKFRYWQNELNEVLYVKSDSIFLRYPISENFTTD